MFKLNAKFDAYFLLYLLTSFECDGHTVHMLTQWHLLPPLTSTVKSSLFKNAHSGPLSWLSGYIVVAQTVLVILTVAALFLDGACIFKHSTLCYCLLNNNQKSTSTYYVQYLRSHSFSGPFPDRYTSPHDPSSLEQFLYYLCNESQHFHLASFMVRTEAPEELILRRVAVGHSSIVQVP